MSNTVVRDTWREHLSNAHKTSGVELSEALFIEKRADVVAAGASVIREMTSRTESVKDAMLRELGPLEEPMLQLDGAISDVDVQSYLESLSKPTWWDQAIEGWKFTRVWWGVIARLIKKSRHALTVINEKVAEILKGVDLLTADVTLKEALVIDYQKYEDDLWAYAYALDLIMQERISAKAKIVGTDSDADQERNRLQGLIDLLEERIPNLAVAAFETQRTWRGHDVSAQAEWSLINKTGTLATFGKEKFMQVLYQVVSALKMARVSKVAANAQQMLERMITTGATVEKEASAMSLREGRTLFVSLGTLQTATTTLTDMVAEHTQIREETGVELQKAQETLGELLNALRTTAERKVEA